MIVCSLSPINAKNANRIHGRELRDEYDDESHEVNNMICGKRWWGRLDCEEVKHTDDSGTELAGGCVLPAVVELLPPGALVVRRGRRGPVRGKWVAFEPVKYVEGDDCVGDVDKGPRLEVTQARVETDQETDSRHDAQVEGPRSWRVQPLHAHIVRLRPVACLHSARRLPFWREA